ncbi:RNA polymerase sigma-70 factor [Dyadobacter sp. CY261]|uniref:RNA polymerase sigma-70 factor n=1 Tax=Dyadobacter sp. CY261 TaxID=2907203 RepID=UPI001F3ED1E3|nr:RNA polymerase sigma-70 factor [Dyadobacter sp. CY261]MCF0072941.1 RNA polymerase sigma-70 factor [Dyadobacter sp. CY261]
MQPLLPDDAQLLERLGNNDPQAFEDIYRRYWKRLHDFACTKTHDADTAGEIVQELFVTLWERRDSLHIKNLQTYLFTAVRNRVIDHFKEKAFTALDSVDSASEPEYPIFLDELEQAMEQAVGQLPEKTRRVFVLSRLEGNTVRQISSLLGMPERTVEYHITQALRKLKTLLKEFIFLMIGFLAAGKF